MLKGKLQYQLNIKPIKLDEGFRANIILENQVILEINP